MWVATTDAPASPAARSTATRSAAAVLVLDRGLAHGDVFAVACDAGVVWATEAADIVVYGGTSSGMFAELLTWLEESRSQAIVLGTLNCLDKLDAALESRFQARFFVDLPVHSERLEVAGMYLGEFGDTFGPGKHTLTTDNIPVLTNLKSWKYAFESPFKADVYYVVTRAFTGNKWGTANPVMMRDADFGVVRLRAYGTYDFRVVDPKKFLREVAGTDDHFRLDEFADAMRSRIVSIFTDAIASAKVPVLDVASRYTELGEALLEALHEIIPSAYNLFDWTDARGNLVRYFFEGPLNPEVTHRYFEEFHNRRLTLTPQGDIHRIRKAELEPTPAAS